MEDKKMIKLNPAMTIAYSDRDLEKIKEHAMSLGFDLIKDNVDYRLFKTKDKKTQQEMNEDVLKQSTGVCELSGFMHRNEIISCCVYVYGINFGFRTSSVLKIQAKLNGLEIETMNSFYLLKENK
jgi:hypothetical protein